VDELATLLRVNRKTVYDALSRGEIPGARRVGGCYRIHRDAVLERRTVRSANSYAAIVGARRWMASRLTTAA